MFIAAQTSSRMRRLSVASSTSIVVSLMPVDPSLRKTRRVTSVCVHARHTDQRFARPQPFTVVRKRKRQRIWRCRTLPRLWFSLWLPVTTSDTRPMAVRPLVHLWAIGRRPILLASVLPHSAPTAIPFTLKSKNACVQLHAYGIVEPRRMHLSVTRHEKNQASRTAPTAKWPIRLTNGHARQCSR